MNPAPRRLVPSLLLAMAMFFFLQPAFAAKWETPFQRQDCVRNNYRQFASKLLNAKDWIKDCNATAADIGGVHFDRPSRCKKDLFHVWGEFDVPDTACNTDPYWDPPQKQGCSANGVRQYAATLQRAKNWIPDCERTAGNVNGVSFVHPSRCKSDVAHVWGEFDVPDQSCSASWDKFERQSCVAYGLRKYASRLLNAHDWIPDCQHTQADVAGTHFSTPSKCSSDPFHVWGEFYVPDVSCPHYDSISAGDCSHVDSREYSGTLLESTDWYNDCMRQPADVDGVHFTHATRCNTDITHVWGQFDIPDNSCEPYFNAPSSLGCQQDLMLYTAQLLNVPVRDNAHTICESGRWKATINGQLVSPVPNSCTEREGVFAHFLVKDDACAKSAKAASTPPASPSTATCDGVNSILIQNDTDHEQAAWIEEFPGGIFTELGHLSAGGQLQPKQMPSDGHKFDTYVLSVTAVAKWNEQHPKDLRNADSSAQKDGALWNSNFYDVEVPELTSCKNSVFGYSTDSGGVYVTSGARDAQQPRPAPKLVPKGQWVLPSPPLRRHVRSTSSQFKKKPAPN